jgi:predicted Zn-dependent protease with MMP-like domain
MANEEGKPGEDKLFDQVILEVISELAPDLKAALGTVQILVQESPGSNPLKRGKRKSDDDLLGLFDGLSLKDWPAGMERNFPDRIILYKENLKRFYPKKADLKREIRKTLLHELGHFFGFSEKELRDRGYE